MNRQERYEWPWCVVCGRIDGKRGVIVERRGPKCKRSEPMAQRGPKAPATLAHAKKKLMGIGPKLTEPRRALLGSACP